MDTQIIEQLANQLLDGQLTPQKFAEELTREHSAQLDHATLDLDRQRRCGFPEVVFGEGKSVKLLTQIFQTLLAEQINVLATRVDAQKAEDLLVTFPQGRYNHQGRTFRIELNGRKPPIAGPVAVVTAGSSDLAVAEEARETLDWMGTRVEMIHDVGVAGPQRLLEHVPTLSTCDAVVVVAGMEGALPSVVGGHVPCPVIAVPTSVGYGASFGGLAALLGMLNSCAANVTVVNIDAGFKGGYIAGMIAAGRQAVAEKS